MTIIAVDDEKAALAALERAIGEALPNERPVCFSQAADALAFAEKQPVDVAFLDVKMSGMDGLALARALAAIRPATNIIFVTGHPEYSEAALELYASGYVRKPVQARRIRREIANLRHPPNEDARPQSVRVLGPYTFDHTAQRVYHNGRDALLKPKEFQLFCLFAASPGASFPPQALFKKVWGDEASGNYETVRVHISGLRKKLAMHERGNPTIKKRRGAGYYLDMEP